MNKVFLRITSLFLVMSLLSACAGGAPAGSAPAASAESTAEAAANTEAQPTEEAAPSAEPEETTPELQIAVQFDPNAYQDPDNDDYLNALTYITNPSVRTVQLTIQCQAFDEGGNLISAYDQFRGKYLEKYTTDLSVPAGTENLPIGFTLPVGYKYDLSTDKNMPAVDHLEFELLEAQEVEWEDLRGFFTLSSLEEKSGHIYAYEKFDQEIEDNYTTLYPNYTLLGYSNGEVVSVSCLNSYPHGTTSVSVSYAKENTDSSMMIYRSVPREPVDLWELHLGCVGGE